MTPSAICRSNAIQRQSSTSTRECRGKNVTSLSGINMGRGARSFSDVHRRTPSVRDLDTWTRCCLESLIGGTSGDILIPLHAYYLPDDDACRVNIASADNKQSEPLLIPGPEEYDYYVEKCSPLPSLHPDDLIALLDMTTRTKLYQLTRSLDALRLTIRNQHPTRLLSGAEERLTWNLIPVESLTDPEDDGIPVKVVDTREKARDSSHVSSGWSEREEGVH
ncbi:hypothetical protein K435DRAFT_834386 [Dendrothele bispora CBS 962.96]|uniref:Uncharacterized protein n=1 Tax=Dendrothele bispora (strain CBS 962.96) TaxID=1314807 RepID=A0A4S8MSV9_DENBC|nr:hypothetical protein K435DRAFT_834386 [Dendrothele bispora CBS 962.96]